MTSLRLRSKHRVAQTPNFRFFIVRGLVVFLFLVLGARLVYVQGFMISQLDVKANRRIPSRDGWNQGRNKILDRNYWPLAESVQVESCFVDPTLLIDKRQTLKILGDQLNLDYQTLLRKLGGVKGSFVWIKRCVCPRDAYILKSLDLKGVGFKKEWRRFYPNGLQATHLLGVVGIDGEGLSGLEQRYNSQLCSRKELRRPSFNKLPRGHLRLTIDSQIQRIVERELDWGARKCQAKRGTVIVQDPRTGEILSVASWPTLTLDTDHPPDSLEMRIPSVVDIFEPGSTFKVVTAAAALEEGILQTGELFDGERGAWQVAGITIHDHDVIKEMHFDDILVYSSNIGAAKLGQRLGARRLYQYARLFGFGVYPGSGLPGEAKGTLRPPWRWSGVSDQVIAFGQEVGVTAIQLAGAYSAIANGGVLMEPKILKDVLSDEGEELWSSEPFPVRRVMRQQTSEHLVKVLGRVVEEGTGKKAQLRWCGRIKAAGKTGTAQKFDSSNNRYYDKLSLVSFCGFFPLSNPQYTIIVVLDEPAGRSWGGVAAAPVFERIAEQIAHQFLIL